MREVSGGRRGAARSAFRPSPPRAISILFAPDRESRLQRGPGAGGFLPGAEVPAHLETGNGVPRLAVSNRP